MSRSKPRRETVMKFIPTVIVLVVGLLLSPSGAGSPPGEVRVEFYGKPQGGLRWSATPVPKVIIVRRGELLQTTVVVRSQADREIQVVVGHRVEPPEAAVFLPLIDCSLIAAPSVKPSETEEFESGYFLRSSLPDDIKVIRVTYEFNVLNGGLRAEVPIQLGKGQLDLRDGKRVYFQRCFSCHGETGRGDGILAKSLDPKPQDLRSFLRDRSDENLLAVIVKGKGMMPAFGQALTEEERRNVSRYVRIVFGSR